MQAMALGRRAALFLGSMGLLLHAQAPVREVVIRTDPYTRHNCFVTPMAPVPSRDHRLRIAISEARTSSNFIPTNPKVGWYRKPES
jgi:hypothetical protein